MKKFLLSFLLTAPFLSLFAQLNNPNYPCPLNIKSNQGGGSCPEILFNGELLRGTAVVTLTFAEPVTCVPRLVSVTDHNGEVRFLKSGVGEVQRAPNDNRVEYCLYGEQSEDNFFNQPDLIATLVYPPGPCNGTTSPDSVTIRCDEEGTEIPLPVNFSLFDTKRNRNNVNVTWTTAQEQNNAGFYIQRNINGVWLDVAFIASKADGGNSGTSLTYTYTDINNFKGVTQYRIRQVDFDSKYRLSNIRSVRGEALSSKIIVYPNPTNTGKVNIVFDDMDAVRNVIVNDINGRMVQQWRGIKDNNFTISNLMPGMYSIKVMNTTTGEQNVEKLIVTK